MYKINKNFDFKGVFTSFENFKFNIILWKVKMQIKQFQMKQYFEQRQYKKQLYIVIQMFHFQKRSLEFSEQTIFQCLKG